MYTDLTDKHRFWPKTASASLLFIRVYPLNPCTNRNVELRLLRFSALDEATKKDAYRRLIACGLSPRFALEQETVESYIRES